MYEKQKQKSFRVDLWIAQLIDVMFSVFLFKYNLSGSKIWTILMYRFSCPFTFTGCLSCYCSPRLMRKFVCLHEKQFRYRNMILFKWIRTDIRYHNWLYANVKEIYLIPYLRTRQKKNVFSLYRIYSYQSCD